MDWVYGYNGAALGPNLLFTEQGELVYFAGAMAVVLDIDAPKQQRVMPQHDMEISCVCLHPSETFAATAQCAPVPHLKVWRVDTCQHVANVGWVLPDPVDGVGARGGQTANGRGREHGDPSPVPFYERSICCCAFAGTEGQLLVASGADERHTIGVVLAVGELLCKAPGMKGQPPEMYQMVPAGPRAGAARRLRAARSHVRRPAPPLLDV